MAAVSIVTPAVTQACPELLPARAANHDLPLAQSKHILITALAQDKQTGARYSADGTRLEATGTAPLLLEPVQATIRFAGAKPVQINVLEHYGVPTGETVPFAADGSFAISGLYRSYYYEVKR